MPPRSLVTSAAGPLYHLGSAWYFVPETVAVGRTIGLDGFRFYFLGRGGVLGDVEWPVVLSAFGYFNPSLIEKMWTTAKERCPVADAVQAHLGCCHAFGRAKLADVDGLGPFCEAADAVRAAALVDPSGLGLFAGYGPIPLPDDLPARAMQLVSVLRELRGSVHLLAVVASGLPTPVAHAIRRPDAVEFFGWSPGDVPAPTAPDRQQLDAAEDLTNRLLAPAFSVLDENGAAALLHGLDGIEAAVAPAGS